MKSKHVPADATAFPTGGNTRDRARSLSPRPIPRSAPFLNAHGSGPGVGPNNSDRSPSAALRKIIGFLKAHSGADFTHYKPGILLRRIARRMVLSGRRTHEAYAALLEAHPEELASLHAEALIGVTRFFRDPEAFTLLQREVFPYLLKNATPGQPFRIWCPGCSTGQEVYSLAMALSECLDAIPAPPPIQIFATDLNEASLETARRGFYPKSRVAGLSSDRMHRFLTEEAGGYRVIKSLRRPIIFSRHDLLSDAPLSNMDMISCRNLLIYLEADAQRHIVAAFHHALKPDGVLFLGAGESAGGDPGLFEPMKKMPNILAKRPSVRFPVHTAHLKHETPKSSLAATPVVPEHFDPGSAAPQEADRLALRHFVPPGVLINEHGHVVQFRGIAAPFVEIPSGRPTTDLFKMVNPALRLPLRAAFTQSLQEKAAVAREDVRLAAPGERRVDLHIIPLGTAAPAFYLVLFAERPTAAGAPATRAEGGRVRELERELAALHAHLKSAQEEHEAAHDRLRAFHEDLQSANEELQSINAELETSKQELESTNGELRALNEEMRHRHTELNLLGADLNNLFVNINTPVLVLGRDLNVRRFTPSAMKIFNLLPGDAGRPLRGVRHELTCANLGELVTAVIETAGSRDDEVQDSRGHWYSLRLRPYMTLDSKIDGAVVMLTDIDHLKRNEQSLRAARDYAESILRAARDPILVLDANLRVKSASEEFYKIFKTTPRQTEGQLLSRIGNGQWEIPSLHAMLAEVLSADRTFNDFEVARDFPGLGPRHLVLNARPLETDMSARLILLTIQDTTERTDSRAALRRSEIRYRRLFETAHDGILLIDPVTRKITDANPYIIQFLGLTRDELLGRELWEIGLAKDESANKAAFVELQSRGAVRYDDLPLVTKRGEVRSVEFVSNLYEEDGVTVVQCNIRDISARQQSAVALRKSEQRARRILESITDSFYVVDSEWRLTDMNSSARRTFAAQGLNPDWILGKNFWSEAFADMGGTAVEHEYRRAMQDRVAVELEYFHEAWQCWFAIRVYPIEDGGLTVYFHDISERKRAEAAMVTALENLKLAQGAAARASHAKNDFLAALSHELRTPLAPVLMTAAALREDSRLPIDVREQLGMMERNIALEARLIDDLLDLTKISHDKLQMRAQPCDAHHLIGLAIEIVQEDAWAKDITIERVQHAHYSGLMADPARIQQVLWNLLRNAVKFTPREGRICVRTRNENNDRGDPWLLIEVSDSGIGIDASRLEQIFMPFDQGGLTGDHRFGGVGLGLSIARSVLDMHGGKIHAESEGPNHGATFIVELPCVHRLPAAHPMEATEPVALPAPGPKGSEASSKTASPLRLLLVEDHPSTLRALCGFLRGEGHHVVAVPTVSEALAAAEAEEFDLVVSDLGLPDGLGIDLMRRLRDAFGLRGIALSGYGMEEDLHLSLESGFVTHLVKPVSISDLRRVITSLPPRETVPPTS